ncbi:MAG: uncharacterized membrane protein YjgN (DUF898 family) [Alphaproteobacteria bacterium]|jgi:uncharacterized membrane protein YjgN (DUF898 family)
MARYSRDGGVMTDTVINSGVTGRGVSPQNERIVGFWGRRMALVGLLMMNSLLGFLTAGVYRFWARTRLRQYFWRSIEIDGDPLEYTGRGLELFVGFLIVIAVLVPLSIGYSVVSLFLETAAPAIFDAVNFLYFVFLFWLTRYAYFRARRYRLARTVWRGIRAGQDGSASGYAWIWFGYAVLSVITLGWAVPWLTAELQRYEVENARFGVENFRYEGTGSKLFRAWVPCGALWTLGIVSAVGLTFTNFQELDMIFVTLQDVTLELLENEDPVVVRGIMAGVLFHMTRLLEIYGIVIVSFLVSIPFYFIYRIGALRYMFNVSNLSAVGFEARFNAWRIVGNWFLYALVSIMVLSAMGALLCSAGSQW